MKNEMSNAEYHSRPEISKSGLDLVAKSPAHYARGFSGIDADAARVGTAFHSWVLEDKKDLLVAPSFGPRSGKQKPIYEDWFEANGATHGITSAPAAEWFPEFERQTGKSLVSEKEYNDMEAMVNSVRNNELAADLLSSGLSEQSIFARYLDIECKCRPDHITGDGKRLVDLKTTKDASRRGFRQSCSNFRYHVQDAFYSQIYSEETGIFPEFYFIAVEKTAPFGCAVYQLTLEAKENGHYLMERDIETIKRCRRTNEWPGYSNDLVLDIPIYEKETFEVFIDGLEQPL